MQLTKYKYCVSFNFKHEYKGKMLERAENVKLSMKLTILEAMVKGYNKCSFVTKEKIIV